MIEHSEFSVMAALILIVKILFVLFSVYSKSNKQVLGKINNFTGNKDHSNTK